MPMEIFTKEICFSYTERTCDTQKQLIKVLLSFQERVTCFPFCYLKMFFQMMPLKRQIH